MTYDYRCSACTHAWETSQKITEPPVTLCPACGQETAVRQISGGGGFRLGGGGSTGWGRDLYASSPKSPPPKSE